MTLVQKQLGKAESEKDLAYKVNGCAVGFLSTICKEINALFVHFSTDYVFDGENHLGYKEDHPYKPINIYGKSKALGEKMGLFSGEMKSVKPIMRKYDMEIKDITSKARRKRQNFVRKLLVDLGFSVYKIDSFKQFKEVLLEELGG